MTTAKRIKNLRRVLGLTQIQLAQRWGTTQTTVARWEAGQEPAGPVLRLLELEEAQAAWAAPDPWPTDDPYIPNASDTEYETRRIEAFSRLLGLHLWGMVEDELQRLWRTIGAGHGSVFGATLRLALKMHRDRSPLGDAKWQDAVERLEAIAKLSAVEDEAMWGQNERGFPHQERADVVAWLASHPEDN